MSKVISADDKKIAKTLATAFGVKPTVKAYWDEAERVSIDILRCPSPVVSNIVDYGTIGLSNHPIYNQGKEFKVRLELVSTAKQEFDYIPNLLSTAAFIIIKNKWFCHPGAVLMSMIDMYDRDVEVKHLYFTSPSLWDDNLETQDLETKTVTWLQAIPITEQERHYIIENGDEALENVFEQSQIDVSDLNRKSAV